jgi:hypothetical protein
MSRCAPAAAAVFAIVWLGPAAAHAGQRIYSYEAVSPAARVLAPTGLSFQFEKHLMGGARVERIIQTGERGFADVRPSSDAGLGAGGLGAALAGARPAGALYEIEADGAGRAFVQAVCPGAAKAWLLIGPLERFRDLQVQAVGRRADAAGAHKCVELQFAFHSEWSLPPDRNPPRARFPSSAP